MKAQFEKKEFGIHIKRYVGFRGFVPMFHEHGEVIYVQKGGLSICVDGENYRLKAGELCVVFPYVIHSYEEAPEAEAIVLLFAVGEAKGFEENLLTTKPETFHIRGTEEIDVLMNRMLFFRKPAALLEENLLSAYLQVLLGEILHITGSVEVPEGNLNVAQRILSYCSEHYKEDISIKNVARACFVSEGYVTQIFTGKLRIPFRTYINQLRVTEAKQLLKKKELKILDVMYGSGFKNQSSFNRIFMEETGMTPRAYREKAEREKKI